MVRSVALFVHIVGMLVLFVGLALEWLSLDSLRKAASPAAAAPWLTVLRTLPRLMAAAVAIILLSGIYLALHVGVFDLAWVRVSFGAMVLMGILGGPAIRAQMRAILQTADDDAGSAAALRRHASHPLIRASIRTRLAVALAIVYLMIGKPDLDGSLWVSSLALVAGVATSVPGWRAQLPALDGQRHS